MVVFGTDRHEVLQAVGSLKIHLIAVCSERTQWANVMYVEPSGERLAVCLLGPSQPGV
jgi:hypothetical protein